jgi:hypothetical protein
LSGMKASPPNRLDALSATMAMRMSASDVIILWRSGSVQRHVGRSDGHIGVLGYRRKD